MRVGIDLLGSDTPPADLFPAVLRAVNEKPSDLTLVAFATGDLCERLSSSPLPPSVKLQPVRESIAMDDDPLQSIRKKKHSSLVFGMQMLKKKKLDAFISPGNTGALIAASTLMLPKLPGIRRPALLAALPTMGKPLAIVDVGGNVSCKAEHLLQFALLGDAYYRCSGGQGKARVGLLNIGIESKKGTAEHRKAYTLLQETFGMTPSGSFIGNIEARDIFTGAFDVLVTDGFTGNVLLKTSEGVASFIFDYARVHTPSQTATANVQAVFDYTEHPGAIVCGTEGLVIKCHGSASAASVYRAIMGAVELLANDFIAQMKQALMA